MKNSSNNPGKYYGRVEERLNGLTHGLGAVFSVIGLVVLIFQAVKTGDIWYIISFSVYGVSLVSMYLSSTLYHSIDDPVRKVVLQKLDHSAIFLLIAGTYTPFLLVNLRGALGWSLFGIVWGITMIGLILKFRMISRWKGISVGLYLGMGWLAVFAGKELVRQLDSTSLILLIIGGLCYTIGVVFYLWRRLPYNHAIWHLFVLGGSVTHYFSILNIL